ncbi:phosphatase PAP2 family protein [Paraburkholderia sp. UCT31]|uniref:phosphatase PAP2 family protein n=1 Tax=Paraburkholderia sp. UCT31 TaxID=2615209 RepID=UPI001656102D|nr:phosphatase PAP2 family protein [Paraburkholderia sp. UCT31]MBC8741886.1 phosphatase PAP2 family protein [Paraburkholderia sp. UCT31]
MKDFLYDFAGHNVSLFLAINGHHYPSVVGLLALLAAFIFSPLLTIPYGMLLTWWLRRRREQARAAIRPQDVRRVNIALTNTWLTLLVGSLLVEGLKLYFHFPRPVGALGASAVHVIGHASLVGSFPSGHTTLVAMLAGIAWPMLGRFAKAGAVLLVVAVALSRIIVGAHFPADVIYGAVLGGFLAIGARAELENFHQRVPSWSA